jgi:hypothetical protein
LDGGRTFTAWVSPWMNPEGPKFFDWTVPNWPTQSAVLDIRFGCEPGLSRKLCATACIDVCDRGAIARPLLLGLTELARVFMRFDHVARVIVNTNPRHHVMRL